MRSISTFFTAAMLLVNPAAAQAPPPADATAASPADEPAARLQAWLDRASAFSATFEQTAVRARTGRTRTRRGRVRVARPDRVRWDYTAPEKLHYVSDGEVLWAYQPADALAWRLPLTDGGLDQALRLLAGGVRLAEVYQVAAATPPEGLPQGDTSYLSLTPRKGEAPFKEMLLGVGSDGALVATAFVDPDGNLVRTRYADFKQGAIADKVFRFRPPPGVRVREAGPPSPGAP